MRFSLFASASRGALLALALATSGLAAHHLGLPFVSAAVAQTSDFVIEDHEIEVDKKTSLAIPRIEVKGSNLSEADFLKMIDPDTKKDEAQALASRFSASSLSIPTIEIDAEKGYGEVSGFSAGGIKAGVIERISWQGITFEANDEDPKAKGSKMSVGPMMGANLNLSSALTLGKAPISTAARGRTTFEVRDLRLNFPEQQKGSKPGPMIEVSVASLWGDGQFDDAGLPVASKGGLRNFVFAPAPGSESGKALAQFGYPKIDAGFDLTLNYDPASMKVSMPSYTLSGVGMGALTLMAELGGIDKFAFTGDERERTRAFMNGDLASAGLKFVNEGIFEKALAMIAQRDSKSPEALKQEWSGLVGQMLPILLGGDSAALQLAAEVQKFIASPKNLSISLTTKSGPIPFSDFQSMKDPMALLRRIALEARANQ